MTRYLCSAFSPAMLSENSQTSCIVQEQDLQCALSYVVFPFISAIGHEVTAKIVSSLLNIDAKFNRSNIKLEVGDSMLVVIPQLRLAQSCEFTKEQILDAGVRFFYVTCY